VTGAEDATDRAEPLRRALAAARRTEPVVHAYAELFADAGPTGNTGQQGAPAHVPAAATAAGWMIVGVKDTIEVREAPVRAGGSVPLSAGGRDARAVALLRAAGATIVGRQHCHLFGLGRDTPPTRNAWDPGRYPGGSSAGAGVSVALGSATVALGTDAAGSIRKPAALNGVVGYRPTPGLVACDGIVPGPSPLNQIGWVTRTVAHSRAVASVLGVPVQARRRHGPVRVAVLAGTTGPTVDQGGARAIGDALKRAADAGHHVAEAPFRDHDEAAAAFGILLAAETAAVHARLLGHPACPDWAAELFASPPSGAVTARAARVVARARLLLTEAIAGYDVLATPTVELPPLPVTEMTGPDGLVDPAVLARYSRWTALASLARRPAMSIPAGLDDAGLPVGLQLIGTAGQDAGLFAVAAALVEPIAFGARPSPLPVP
jgi:Asp-tRNA(Asn)/Glu-tRNA(Gln) amidotransferase A subunit family amidase